MTAKANQDLGYLLSWVPDQELEMNGVWSFGSGGFGTVEDFIQMQAEAGVELWDGNPYESDAVPLYDNDDNLVAVWCPMGVAPETVRQEIAASEGANIEWATYFVDTTNGDEFNEDSTESDNDTGHQDLAAQEDEAYNYE